MQGPHRGHDHQPPGLRLALAAGGAALAFAAPAAATQSPLPSPLAPLSPSPPLSGGASSITERIRHRVASATVVRVSVDSSGRPFAVVASQRLQVGVTGDYFFTIGAPVLDAEALPGSDSTPGVRSSSIVWAGFNPGRRTLAARMTLSPAVAAASLPLRIEVHGGTTTLVNTTGVTVTAVTADAEAAPLVTYLQELRAAVARGEVPASGTATLRGPTRPARVHVVAPLLLRGTVGGVRVDARLTGRLTVRSSGPVSVAVTAADPRLGSIAGLDGREALARATSGTLAVARVRQFRSFLGNPDPSGPSETRYVFRSAERPAPPVAAQPFSQHRDWGVTLAVAAGLLLALGGGFAVWARA